MKKLIKGPSSLFVLGLFFLLPAFLPAQTAAELETVMKASVVTCAQAARFVNASIGSNAPAGGGNSPEGNAPAQNEFEQALAKGWFPKGTTPNESITLGKLSLLIMQAFELRGGLMYIIFPGQRYAFRTMVSRSFIQGAADPAMTVTGQRFLDILGRVVNAEGANK